VIKAKLKKTDIPLKDRDKRPEIRCRVIRNRLKALELFDSPLRKRILERLSEKAFQAIHSAHEDDWVPIEYNVELSESLAAEMGEEGIYNVGVKAFDSSINSSFIAPFIRAALTLVKVRPNLLLKLAPQFWNSIHRNCGELSIEEKGPGQIQVVLKDLPLVMVKSRNHMLSVAAFVQAFSPYSEVQGSAVLEEVSEKTQSAVISVSWEPES
jgi:hypothetical protein